MTEKNQAKPFMKPQKNTENAPHPAGNPENKKPVHPMTAEIEKLKKENADLKDKFLRTYAEMENIRKRSQLEIEKNAKVAIGDFALDLLPAVDNLERATAQQIPAELVDNAFVKSLLEGVQMTQKLLLKALEKNGVKAIESVGKPFDPNTQKAIQEVVDETKDDGTVVQEWQKGYTIAGDRILREAMVIVSKKA